jgi:hypothetical protein
MSPWTVQYPHSMDAAPTMPHQIDSESYVANLHGIRWRMAARTRAMNSSALNGFVI